MQRRTQRQIGSVYVDKSSETTQTNYYQLNSYLSRIYLGNRTKSCLKRPSQRLLTHLNRLILTIPGLAGFAMKVKANSVTFPDGSKTGLLIVSPVTADKLPMSPPAGGAQFGVPAWTIQPAGTRFDPPIEVTLPNTRAYPAGDNIPVVQWDHDLGQYVAMGRATVSEDGAVLITDSGSGLTKAGWGGAQYQHAESDFFRWCHALGTAQRPHLRQYLGLYQQLEKARLAL